MMMMTISKHVHCMLSFTVLPDFLTSFLLLFLTVLLIVCCISNGCAAFGRNKEQ